jgi:hypothetical protein
MARDENAPEPGKILGYYSDDLGQTLDTTGTAIGKNREGQEFRYEDENYAATPGGVHAIRSGKPVIRRIVRNANTTVYAKPKEFWQFKTDGSTGDVYGGQISALGTAVGQNGALVDEFLPAAGAPPGSLLLVVIEGPATGMTATTGDTNISIGQSLIPGAAGQLIDQDTSVAAGAATFAQMRTVGIALTAVNATNSDILVLARRMDN